MNNQVALYQSPQQFLQQQYGQVYRRGGERKRETKGGWRKKGRQREGVGWERGRERYRELEGWREKYIERGRGLTWR